MFEQTDEGKILLVAKQPYETPPALDDAIAANQQQQAQQERVIEHRRRVTEHKPAERKQPLKLTQLQMELEPA